MLRFLPQWNLTDYFCGQFGWTGDTAFVAAIVGVFLCIVIGYLLGSLNSAIIISHLFLRRDIRAHGSKNAGATNMLRTFGKRYAVMTLALDMIKAAVATTLGFYVCQYVGAPIAGFFCIFGHMFPVYYRFKGGKGVACTAIVALMIDPWTFLVMFFCFFVIVFMTRFVSLASVMCAFLYPLLIRAFVPLMGTAQLMAILTTVFVVFMHRENIKRLYNGKESKVNLFGKKEAPPSENMGGHS